MWTPGNATPVTPHIECPSMSRQHVRPPEARYDDRRSPAARPRGNAAVTRSDEPLPVILVVDDGDCRRGRSWRPSIADMATTTTSRPNRRRRTPMATTRGPPRRRTAGRADRGRPPDARRDGRVAASPDRIRLHPRPQRLLLTDWSDFTSVEATVQAIILGEIDTWIARPFSPADEEFHAVLTAALARWTHESDRAGVAFTIVGDPWDAAAGGPSGCVRATPVPVRFRDAASPEGQALLARAGAEGRLPVVILADGRRLPQPSQADVAMAIGLQRPIGDERVDVAVIGGGPAGLAAAVYGASEGLSCDGHRVDRHRRPGQLQPDDAELPRFPGRRDGCRADSARFQQAITFGVKFVLGRARDWRCA